MNYLIVIDPRYMKALHSLTDREQTCRNYAVVNKLQYFKSNSFVFQKFKNKDRAMCCSFKAIVNVRVIDEIPIIEIVKDQQGIGQELRKYQTNKEQGKNSENVSLLANGQQGY